jgi:hypothetical protein
MEIYTTVPPTPIMTDIIVKIMIELLSVLALATKQINQGRFSKCAATNVAYSSMRVTEKFAKSVLGENKIEAVLQRLDRLTQDEAQISAAQTLGVVHRLVGSMKVVMEGAACCMIAVDTSLKVCSDGKTSTDSIRQGLSMSHAKQILPLLTLVRSRPSPSAKQNE